MKCVIEYDRLEREKREHEERQEASASEEQAPEKSDVHAATAPTAEPRPTIRASKGNRHEDESDEYEEVEVTDDEDDDGPLKRQKVDMEDGPIEFDEEDMAYQLAAMGEDYGLDPGEYGDGQGEDWEEGAEGLPLTEEDSKALFNDMLNDFHIDPYTPWEKIIEDGSIIEDERYTCLPNMKSRKEAWCEWSRKRIQHLKEQREKEEKKDPKIPYFAFLQKQATPKLYWPEFRRKYKKEPEMRDTKLSDKDREKWYRDYINRLKLPESSLKSDLTALLKSLSLREINRSTSLKALPPTLLTDMRYISLRAQVRDPLIEAFIAISPPAPEDSGFTAKEEVELMKQRKDRERREKALAERERMVEDEKRKQRGILQHSKGMLREGEEEIERAMQVGKEGLLSHLEVAQKDEPPASGSIE
ncbi:transcription elongation regulator [Xylographa opegraphella]|nr:transcription elongation regulator [Xylographa opegraphella]